MRRWLVVVLALAIAAPAFAQPAGSGAPAADQQQTRREKIKKRIRALRAYTLTEELSLDEQTAGKLFPLLAKYDDEFDKLLVARVDLEKRLQQAGQLKDNKDVDKLIDEAAANQKALWDTDVKRLAELRKILTPQQVARTLVVLPKMERQIQNQLRKAAMAKQQPRNNADPFDDGGDIADPFAGPRKGGAKGKKAPARDEDFEDIDPFAAPPAKGAGQPAKAGAKNQPPCDPFSSLHSCK